MPGSQVSQVEQGQVGETDKVYSETVPMNQQWGLTCSPTQWAPRSLKQPETGQWDERVEQSSLLSGRSAVWASQTTSTKTLSDQQTIQPFRLRTARLGLCFSSTPVSDSLEITLRIVNKRECWVLPGHIKSWSEIQGAYAIATGSSGHRTTKR